MFLPTVFEEEKGSKEIKEGRASSGAAYQKKMAKRFGKFLLVRREPVQCQLTLSCKMLPTMQNDGGIREEQQTNDTSPF